MWAVATNSHKSIRALIHLLFINCLFIFSPSSFTQLLTHQAGGWVGAMGLGRS